METKMDRMIDFIKKANISINHDYNSGKISEGMAAETSETLNDIRSALRELESIKLFMAGHIDLK